MNNLTQLIKDYCIDNETNIKQFANLVKISNSLVYKYVNEKVKPTFNNLVKLANFFTCSIDYLVGLDNNYRYVEPKQANKNLFFERYNNLLSNKNATHYKMAQSKNFSNSSHLDWKNGSIPYIDTLIEIAKFFDVTIDYLLGRSDEK